MPRYSLRTLLIVLAIGPPSIAALFLVRLDSSAAQEPTAVVSVADIGNRVTLVGLLGKQLGTMMEVSGTWRYPGPNVKDDSMRFIVSHVDGKELEKPVEFNVAQIR